MNAQRIQSGRSLGAQAVARGLRDPGIGGDGGARIGMKAGRRVGRRTPDRSSGERRGEVQSEGELNE